MFGLSPQPRRMLSCSVWALWMSLMLREGMWQSFGYPVFNQPSGMLYRSYGSPHVPDT